MFSSPRAKRKRNRESFHSKSVRVWLNIVTSVNFQVAGQFKRLKENGAFFLPWKMLPRRLTIFIKPIGRFYFHRLPFGITSAPEIFQKRMTNLLNDQEGVSVIQDDIIVYGRTVAEHDVRLQQVLETTARSGLKLNSEKKCEIRKPKICFFGNVISKEGVNPDPEKAKAIQELPALQNVSELRQVLGLINYPGKFLTNLSHVICPMP